MRAWERRTQWPLLALGVVFLVAYAWPILQPDLPREWRQVCEVVQNATWVAFVVDYVVRLVLSPHKWRFVWTNAFDLVVLALPMLRPLRAMRLIFLLRIFNRSAESTLRGRASVYVIVGVLALSGIAALAVLDAERDVETANIHSFAEAIWWAATTVTTVGYGDYYPVTLPGRLVAVGLMISGIALLGTVTASLASWFNDRVRLEEQATAALSHQVAALTEQVSVLTEQVTTLTSRLGGRGDTAPGTRD